MSIQTFNPLDIAFLKATGLPVPRGHHALREFLLSDAFRDELVYALNNDDFNCCIAHDDIVHDKDHVADVAISRLVLSHTRPK